MLVLIAHTFIYHYSNSRSPRGESFAQQYKIPIVLRAAVAEGVEWLSSNLKVGSSIPVFPLSKMLNPVPHRTTKCC